MPIDLYYIPGSAPCRAVTLTAAALGLELNLKLTDLMKGEHLTPEFIKLNPQHTVPTLNDDGFSLWESRAIIGYLVDQYGKDDSLYPKDAKKRAIVDQRLYFDAGTLYQRLGDWMYPAMFMGASLDPAKLEKAEQAFEFLNTFLEGQAWVAGDNLTIADLSLLSSVATAEAVGVQISKFPNVQKWYSKGQKEVPNYQKANGDGAKTFGELFAHLTAKK